MHQILSGLNAANLHLYKATTAQKNQSLRVQENGIGQLQDRAEEKQSVDVLCHAVQKQLKLQELQRDEQQTGTNLSKAGVMQITAAMCDNMFHEGNMTHGERTNYWSRLATTQLLRQSVSNFIKFELRW